MGLALCRLECEAPTGAESEYVMALYESMAERTADDVELFDDMVTDILSEDRVEVKNLLRNVAVGVEAKSSIPGGIRPTVRVLNRNVAIPYYKVWVGHSSRHYAAKLIVQALIADGILCDYDTGDDIRKATPQESYRSLCEGATGAFSSMADGSSKVCYVRWS